MAAELDNVAQQLDAPPPMRHMETAEEVAERRVRRQRELKKAEAVRAAGGVARERLGQRSGPHRSTLFDGDNWKEQTGDRSRAMEATLSHLYKPTTGAYWTAQRNGTQAPVRRVHSRPSVDLVPSYASALPSALSLAQPAFRAMDELHGVDPAELAQSGQGGAEVFEPFDPMAEPAKFFRNFKARRPCMLRWPGLTAPYCALLCLTAPYCPVLPRTAPPTVGTCTWQDRVVTARATLHAEPAVLELARPASTSNALPPPQMRRPVSKESAPGKKQDPPRISPLPLQDDCPAIYLTALGGDDDSVPTWEPPPAPWGASAQLPGLPTWDDVQLQ